MGILQGGVGSRPGLSVRDAVAACRCDGLAWRIGAACEDARRGVKA